MNHINLKDTLYAKRREKGITQEQLASYLGVTKASVSKWETGQSYPDIVLLPQLATYFDISIDALINYNPQMSAYDIRQLYIQLAKDFSEKPFDQVFMGIEKIVKQYFSCFPLLQQMGILLLNHFQHAEEEKQKEILNYAITLFARIKSQSRDLSLCKQSNCLQALCNLALENPVEAIQLLGDVDVVLLDEPGILANAYVMQGNVEKAMEILQISTYQHLLITVNTLITSLSMVSYEEHKFDSMVLRIYELLQVFEIPQLHPTTALTAYLSIASNYAMQSKTEKAIEELTKYCNLAISIEYPIKLHGDAFFDRIEPMIASLDLQENCPRADTSIKGSIVDSVIQNPAFASLSDTVAYQQICQQLQILKEN